GESFEGARILKRKSNSGGWQGRTENVRAYVTLAGARGFIRRRGAPRPGLRPTPERRRWVSHRREKPGALNVARLKYLVVPAQAGIQARSGAPCAQMPGLRLRRSDEGGC